MACLLISPAVFGWGQNGHRAIGQVAENHLSRKAKKEIRKILGDESLAMASTWMDEIRSDSTYDHTHSWHWVTIPDGETYHDTEKNPEGDLIEATLRMIDSLESKTATMEEKKKYLRYLIHLIGDLHQPLHVGRGDDRGGNTVKIKWFYDNSNLHRIWDSEMIDDKQLSYTEIVAAIDHPSKQQVKQWHADGRQGQLHTSRKSWQSVAVRALVFDVFGTLLDWRTGIADAFRE